MHVVYLGDLGGQKREVDPLSWIPVLTRGCESLNVGSRN